MDQDRIWKGAGGRGWVAGQALLDQAFLPFDDVIVREVETARAERVLDVGCGTGATTTAVARQLGGRGTCVGIDISETMVDAARERAGREGVEVEFLCGDGETYPFESAVFDLIVSRFGVMFFRDPVRAFANLLRAASPGAALRCVVWRDADDNPFMVAAERAAEPLLPGVSTRVPRAPGQFGFAEDDHVRAILEDSGWGRIDITPIDVPCAFPESGLELYLTRLGPVGRALQDANEETRAAVLEAVRPALDPYVRDGEVRFTAACWMMGARADRA